MEEYKNGLEKVYDYLNHKYDEMSSQNFNEYEQAVADGLLIAICKLEEQFPDLENKIL